MTSRRGFIALALLGAGPGGATTPAAKAAAAAAAAPTAPATPAAWRDVLDTPAQRSPLADRGLLTGLARAGHRLVAVGQRGHVLFSDDAGRRWQQADVPASADLVAVHFPSATRGYACGHDGIVLGTRDGGQTWQRLLDGRSSGALMAAYYASQPEPKHEAAGKEAARFAAQGAENPWLDCWFADEQTGFVVEIQVHGQQAWLRALHDGDVSIADQRLADAPLLVHLFDPRREGDGRLDARGPGCRLPA